MIIWTFIMVRPWFDLRLGRNLNVYMIFVKLAFWEIGEAPDLQP